MKAKVIIIGVVLAATIFTGCNNHPSFKNSEEAIDACKKELSDLRSQQKAVDIKKLTEITSNWLELQDSAYSVFSKDSNVTLKSPTALAFFLVSDSIRSEITRIALAEPRSMQDVMYLKVNAVRGRKKVEKSETYKEAVAFYKKLDEIPTITNVDAILPTYMKVLRSSKSFKNEEQFIKFVAAEDKCFRSLMMHLSEISTETLQALTEATGEIFDKFYPIIGSRQNALNDRTMLYLTMRFNRRIIQNALACREDVETGKNLTRDQKANYRWMLIQP